MSMKACSYRFRFLLTVPFFILTEEVNSNIVPSINATDVSISFNR